MTEGPSGGPPSTPATTQAEKPAGVALVTGATGFVGSHLVDALVEEGWRVRCLTRASSSLRWLPRDRIELAQAGLDEPVPLRTALVDVRVVFHLAGLTAATSRAAYARVNVEGTRALLAALTDSAPHALLVFCSSLAAAGPSPDGRPLTEAGLDEPVPLRTALADVRVVFHLAGLTAATSRAAYARVNVEGTRAILAALTDSAPRALLVFCSSLAAAGPSPDGRPPTEADPPRPIGPYGRSKLAAEGFVHASGLDHVIVRPPAVYGPRDPDILAVFKLAARGLALRTASAGQLLSLIHVRDLAHAFLDAAERGSGKGIFYVSDGAVHSWADVIRAIGDAVGRRPHSIPIPAPATIAAGYASRLWARVTGGKPLLTPERARDLAQPAWVCDDGRARKELEYRSVFALPQGMADTAAWYRDNGWL